jgi:hypothetical protein
MKLALAIILMLFCINAYAETYYRMTQGIMVDENGERIKGAEYIMRESDKALIPMTKANPDYLKYLADKDKAVGDFDYEAEDLRQAKALEKTEKEIPQEEIQAELKALAIERIEAKKEIIEER